MNTGTGREADKVLAIRDRLRCRREAQGRIFNEELPRLIEAAVSLGVKKIILFGSMVRDNPRLTSDIDLLILWETPLPFLERTVEMYRKLQPRVPTDLLIYTPEEMKTMGSNSLVKQALSEGKVLYEA